MNLSDQIHIYEVTNIFKLRKYLTIEKDLQYRTKEIFKKILCKRMHIFVYVLALRN